MLTLKLYTGSQGSTLCGDRSLLLSSSARQGNSLELLVFNIGERFEHVAQLVEQRTFNAWVLGSIPSVLTILLNGPQNTV